MKRVVAILRRMPHVVGAWYDSDGFWIRYRAGVVSPRTACESDHEETGLEALQAAEEAGRIAAKKDAAT